MKDNCFTALVSAKYQHGTRMSPPSGTSLPIPLLSIVTEPRDPGVLEQIPMGYLFYMWQCMCPSYSLHTSLPLFLSHPVSVSLFSMSVSAFLLYFLQGFLPRSPQPLCLFLYLQINLVLRSQCVLLIIWDRT